MYKHQRRKTDNKYPVSIRVYWKGKHAYIDTEYYATIQQIRVNEKKGIFELKDTHLINELTRRIKDFESAKVERLGVKIYQYSAKELAHFFEKLMKGERSGDDIKFIEFGRQYQKRIQEEGRNPERMKTSLNALEDFAKGDVYINEITAKFLSRFEKYLLSDRTLIRKNQFGKTVALKKSPVSQTTLSDYMTDIRSVFNEAKRIYNDEDKGDIVVKHYPFKKYKVPEVPISKKRNIPAEDILTIMYTDDIALASAQAILARDVFILSFLLVGMNLKDLYELTPRNYEGGRLNYERSKTKRRRKDNAFISVKVENEAKKIIDKYRDKSRKRLFDFHLRFSTVRIFRSSVNDGLKKVAKVCNIEVPLSSYYARHSWATIARNKCRIAKSDVDECLNHVDADTRMADVYIEKDWSFIDEANRKVIDFVLHSI